MSILHTWKKDEDGNWRYMYQHDTVIVQPYGPGWAAFLESDDEGVERPNIGLCNSLKETKAAVEDWVHEEEEYYARGDR